MQTPTIGRIVHYVSYGTPGGEYGKECRAAVVTEVNHVPTGPNGEWKVGLCVMNPTGLFFKQDVEQDQGETGEYAGGTWHWPEMLLDVIEKPAAPA